MTFFSYSEGGWGRGEGGERNHDNTLVMSYTSSLGKQYDQYGRSHGDNLDDSDTLDDGTTLDDGDTLGDGDTLDRWRHTRRW